MAKVIFFVLFLSNILEEERFSVSINYDAIIGFVNYEIYNNELIIGPLGYKNIKDEKCKRQIIDILQRLKDKAFEDNICQKQRHFDGGGYVLIEIEKGCNSDTKAENYRRCLIDYAFNELDPDFFKLLMQLGKVTRNCYKKRSWETFVEIMSYQYKLKSIKKEIAEYNLGAEGNEIKKRVLFCLKSALNKNLEVEYFAYTWPHTIERESIIFYEIYKDIANGISFYQSNKEDWENSIEWKKIYIDYIIVKNFDLYDDMKFVRDKIFKDIDEIDISNIEKIVNEEIKSKK